VRIKDDRNYNCTDFRSAHINIVLAADERVVELRIRVIASKLLPYSERRGVTQGAGRWVGVYRNHMRPNMER